VVRVRIDRSTGVVGNQDTFFEPKKRSTPDAKRRKQTERR
jgi:hypothetical protein